MSYKYFVSYAHKLGFGHIDFECNKKIKSSNDLKMVEEYIKEKGPAIDPIILYYQLM